MVEQCLCCLWVLLACGFSVPMSCLSRRVNSLFPTHSFTTTKFLFKDHHHRTLQTQNDNSLASYLLFYFVCSCDIKTTICYFWHHMLFAIFSIACAPDSLNPTFCPGPFRPHTEHEEVVDAVVDAARKSI